MDEQTTNAGEMSEQQEGEMPEQQELFDQARAMALIEKLRRENRDLGKAAKRVQELEADQRAKQEAEMTELQRLEARAKAAEERAAQLERAALQREIAAKVGLPAALATRLIGTTAEEMEADAAALLETLPKQPKPTPGIVATNPGANGSAAETREAKKARLMGTPGDIWAGGGILHPEG